MAKRKQTELTPSEKILQHPILIQASLQRIEEWLARIAGVRLQPPAAERLPNLLSREEVCPLLGVTSNALNTRIRRGKFPRPAFGTGKHALWWEEDLLGNGGITKGGADAEGSSPPHPLPRPRADLGAPLGPRDRVAVGHHDSGRVCAFTGAGQGDWTYLLHRGT